jgi:hypothetical protein
MIFSRLREKIIRNHRVFVFRHMLAPMCRGENRERVFDDRSHREFIIWAGSR